MKNHDVSVTMFLSALILGAGLGGCNGSGSAQVAQPQSSVSSNQQNSDKRATALTPHTQTPSPSPNLKCAVVASYGTQSDPAKAIQFLQDGYSVSQAHTKEDFMAQLGTIAEMGCTQVLIVIDAHGSPSQHGENCFYLASDHSSDDEAVCNQDLENFKSSLGKGVQLGIINTSCYSGGSISVADEHSCVISASGPDEAAYATFWSDFWGQAKTGDSLENVYLRARDNHQYISSPRISTKAGLQAAQKMEPVWEVMAKADWTNYQDYFGDQPSSDASQLSQPAKELVTNLQNVVPMPYLSGGDIQGIDRALHDTQEYLADDQKEHASLMAFVNQTLTIDSKQYFWRDQVNGFGWDTPIGSLLKKYSDEQQSAYTKAISEDSSDATVGALTDFVNSPTDENRQKVEALQSIAPEDKKALIAAALKAHEVAGKIDELSANQDFQNLAKAVSDPKEQFGRVLALLPVGKAERKVYDEVYGDISKTYPEGTLNPCASFKF